MSRKVILLLENEESDVFFFRRALSACQFEGEIRVVETMAEGRDYMEGRAPYHDRDYYPLPDLVVSDFKMRGQTGVEFIRWMRGQEGYKKIPVVMFSGTALPNDKAAALQAGAQAFFGKSGNFREMCSRVNEILNYLPRVGK